MGPTHRFANRRTGPWPLCRSAPLLAALLLLAWASPGAAAQIQRVSEETARSVQLTADQRREVSEFVDVYTPLVFGDDPAESARGLDELLGPLRDPAVSVAFRQEMARLLRDPIAEAIGDDRLFVQDDNGNQTVNAAPYSAMRLAGELATQDTVGLLERELTAEDEGRRFFAIYATESVFYAVGNAAPAVTPGALFRSRGDRATGLVPVLGEQLAREASPRHAAAIVRALAEASAIREEQFSDAASEALAQIAAGASARARARRGESSLLEEKLVWITAGQTLFRSIAQPGGAADRDAGLGAVRLAGHLVASVYADLEAERLPPVEDRDGDAGAVQRQMLRLASNLLTFGDQVHAQATSRRPNPALQAAATELEPAYLGTGQQNLTRVALSLISRSGLLTDAPYGFDDDEFIGE